jgi:hypothetical protein
MFDRVITLPPPLFSMVFTFVGLPPTPCFFALFRFTADSICDFDIPAALAAGTHFGYFLF